MQTDKLCNGFTQELVYFSGPRGQGFDLTSDYSVTPSPPSRQSVQAILRDKEWVGVHTFLVRGTNGSFDGSVNARGNNGLYASIDSAPLQVTVTDPCHNSIVNADLGSLFEIASEFVVPLGSSKQEESLAGPSDSISQTFGNGFDICGPLKYEFFYAASGAPLASNHPNFSFSVTANRPYSADDFSMKLISEPYGLQITERLRLRVSLTDYTASSTPAIFETTLVFRECVPRSFEAPTVEDIEIMLGEPKRTVDVHFIQSPC